MKVVLMNGTMRTIQPGESVCGQYWRQVVIEPGDLNAFADPRALTWFLEDVLTRLYPKDAP